MKSRFLEITNEDAVVSVWTEDETLWQILLATLERKGISLQKMETRSCPPDFLIVDGRRTPNPERRARMLDDASDIPVLWIVDRENPTEPKAVDLFPFSEILCFPFCDFELARRFRTLQTFARLMELDRSSRSETMKWKRKAFSDPITGLHNYRYFRAQLRVELRRVIRIKETLSLLVLDLDDFKTLNDRYGHPAGDKLLRDAGRNIQQAMRKTDILARYGGDEFVLILPSVRREEAVKIVGKISERFRRAVFHLPEIDEPCRIAFSAGIAVFPDDAQEMDALIRCADRALLDVKKTGKQQFHFDHPINGTPT
jgi:diguanylate cyclase (GGDEF)-like protein